MSRAVFGPFESAARATMRWAIATAICSFFSGLALGYALCWMSGRGI